MIKIAIGILIGSSFVTVAESIRSDGTRSYPIGTIPSLPVTNVPPIKVDERGYVYCVKE